MTEFDWPCARRTAHGPHEIINTTPLTNDQLADRLLESDGGPLKCPGVLAHPATMIGRPPRSADKNQTE